MPLLVVLLCFFSLANAQTGENPEAIGIVDLVSGHWIRAQDKNKVRLQPGELIFEDQTVLIERTTSASITILMLSTGQPWEMRCTEQAPCGGSYKPVVSGGRQVGFWAFLSKFWTPDRPLPAVVLAARSMAGRGPNHALLPRLGNSVSLKPALEKVAEGMYTVKLIPAPDSRSTNPVSSKETTVRTGPDETPEIKGLADGLYIFALTDKGGDAVGSNAVILVLDNENRRVQEMWRDAKARAQAWHTASPTTVDIFLARVLYSLDAEVRNQ